MFKVSSTSIGLLSPKVGVGQVFSSFVCFQTCLPVWIQSLAGKASYHPLLLDVGKSVSTIHVCLTGKYLEAMQWWFHACHTGVDMTS